MFGNWMGISVLSAFAKIIDKIILKRVKEHFESLIGKEQLGFYSEWITCCMEGWMAGYIGICLKPSEGTPCRKKVEASGSHRTIAV